MQKRLESVMAKIAIYVARLKRLDSGLLRFPHKINGNTTEEWPSERYQSIMQAIKLLQIGLEEKTFYVRTEQYYMSDTGRISQKLTISMGG